MALTVETGVGVRGADAYVTVAFVTSYLTARNRLTENNWSGLDAAVQEAAVIAATDYIEKRFQSRFLGTRLVEFEDVNAIGSIVFSGLPTADQELTLGDQIYKFVSSLTGAANEVLIGVSGAATASNLAAAILADAEGEGIIFGSGTEISRHATEERFGSTITLTSLAAGSSGDSTVLSGTITNVALTAFSGGVDGGSQPLSFPRENLYDRSGNLVEGIPLLLKQATAEYAVRAAAAQLLTDPTTDVYGGRVRRRLEKVGPIEEEIEYDPGTQGTELIKPYPAADRLLLPYLTSGSRVIR